MSVATIATCPGVTPIVELGVGTEYDSTSTAQWDVDTWEPDTGGSRWVGDRPYWLDVTCHVQDIATFTGRERSIDQWEVGTATVTVDNRAGLFDFPLSIADLLDDQTLLSVRPGRSIRIGIQLDAAPPVFLWAGYIDAANPTYDAVEGARLTLECVDAKGDVGRTEIAALATATGAGQTATQRVTTILNAAGWPSYRRSLDGVSTALIATELGGQAVDLLNIAADSAGASVFGDLGVDGSDPRVAFRGRDFLNYDNATPPLGAISDDGVGGSGSSIRVVYAAELVEEPVGSGFYYLPADFTEDPAGSGIYRLDESGMILLEDPAGSGLFYVGELVELVEDPPGSGLYDIPDVVESPAGSGLYVVVDYAFVVEDPAGSGLFYVVDIADAVPVTWPDTCPSSWELTFARSDFSTQVLLGRTVDDVPRIYPTSGMLADTAHPEYQAGLSMFGVETFERTDLETQDDDDLDWLGERILTTRSWTLMPRVAAVTVTGTGSHPETYTTLLQASPFTSSRFKCRHQVDGRLVFDRVMMVTGVEHSITPFGWEARISLDDAEPFLIGGAHPALWDETGVALWDYATWADPT